MAQSRIEEIIVTESSVGKGTQENPCRMVTEYFTKDGRLLFKIDNWELTRSHHDDPIYTELSKSAS